MNAIIHFSRVGKKDALYIEEMLSDDGIRLRTRSILPPEAKDVWSKSVWQKMGILANGEVVTEVRKHHFYQEWFDVIELLDASGELLGYYCDVITPLQKKEGEYYLQDLLLDLWIFPDRRMIELDWDELEGAALQGLIAPMLHQKAVETLKKMVSETLQGIFPDRYINPQE